LSNTKSPSAQRKQLADRADLKARPETDQSKSVNQPKGFAPQSADACRDDQGCFTGPAVPLQTTPYVGCKTYAPCSQPQPRPAGIDRAEAKRLDEIRLQQYSTKFAEEKRFWQVVRAIIDGLGGAKSPDFGSYMDERGKDYQNSQIKKTFPDFMTDDEIVDAAIDEVASQKAWEAAPDPTPQPPAPNAQELWDRFENALKAEDAPAESLSAPMEQARPN